MSIRVINAGSASANYHVHVVKDEVPAHASVSVGLDNERTFAIPVEVRDTRLTLAGTFGSGSASSVVAIDIGPKGSAFLNLFSVSAPFTTTVPVQVDHVLRFRHAATSVTGASVDAWVG